MGQRLWYQGLGRKSSYVGISITWTLFLFWVALLSHDYWIVHDVTTGELELQALGQVYLGITNYETLDVLRYAMAPLFAGIVAYTVLVAVAHRKLRNERY